MAAMAVVMPALYETGRRTDTKTATAGRLWLFMLALRDHIEMRTYVLAQRTRRKIHPWLSRLAFNILMIVPKSRRSSVSSQGLT